MDCYRQAINHMEIWSIQSIKMKFLSGIRCVNTSVLIYHMVADKTYRENDGWELHENTTSNIEQNPESNITLINSRTATYLLSLKL